MGNSPQTSWSGAGSFGIRRLMSSVSRQEQEVVGKGLRIRMGRTPAEIAEGAEVYWEGGKGTYIGAVFNKCLGQLNRYH